MSNDNQVDPKKKQGAPMGGNVIQMPQSCPAEACGKKPRRAGFCDTHFTWFKEGLITRKGEKAKDFDKKYQAFIHKTPKAA